MLLPRQTAVCADRQCKRHRKCADELGRNGDKDTPEDVPAALGTGVRTSRRCGTMSQS